jgi:hypothetical protein
MVAARQIRRYLRLRPGGRHRPPGFTLLGRGGEAIAGIALSGGRGRHREQEGSSALGYPGAVVDDRVTEPYVVGQEAIAGELQRGKWCVYLHEWLGDDHDLTTWRDQVAAYAVQYGVEVCFVEIPRKDMTLVANVRALPSFEQVTQSIAALEHYRGRVAGRRWRGSAQ